ncbi:MAG: hypothetical protein KF898_03245 [Parachlamydiales bacterium]|nr:hypothetical protein [Candidatus Acheromyda pituitae]
MATRTDQLRSSVSTPSLDSLDLATSSPLESDPRRVTRAAQRSLSNPSTSIASPRVRQTEVLTTLPRGGSVHGASLTVPVGSDPSPLTATAQNTENTFVRLTSDPEPGTVLNLQQDTPPKAPVALYNAYTSNGEKKGHYFDLKAKHHTQLQDTFHLVKNHCLETGVIPQNATGFTISFKMMQVRYFDPSSHTMCVRSLKDIMDADPDVKASVESTIDLIKTKINKGEICSKMEDYCKGAADGASPCYRSNPVLAQQPKSIGADSYKKALEIAQPVLTDTADPTNHTKRDLAIHRMGKAETIIKKTKDKIAAEKLPLLASLSTTVDPAARNEIQKKLRELEAVEQRLEQLDTFAIYSALAFYPGEDDPTLADVSRNAELLQKAMSSRLEQERQQAIEDGTARKWIPEWVPVLKHLRKPPEIEKSDSYAVDAAGLMFSGLETEEGRAGYNDLCRAHRAPSKKDGLEDAIVREVLREGSLQSAENPVLERLFEGVSDSTIKASLAGELCTAIDGVHAAASFTLAGADASARADSYRQQANL